MLLITIGASSFPQINYSHKATPYQAGFSVIGAKSAAVIENWIADMVDCGNCGTQMLDEVCICSGCAETNEVRVIGFAAKCM
jgi:hypothetical protein